MFKELLNFGGTLVVPCKIESVAELYGNDIDSLDKIIS